MCAAAQGQIPDPFCMNATWCGTLFTVTMSLRSEVSWWLPMLHRVRLPGFGASQTLPSDGLPFRLRSMTAPPHTDLGAFSRVRQCISSNCLLWSQLGTPAFRAPFW